MNQINKDISNQTKQIVRVLHSQNEKLNPIEDWSETDVKEWFIKNNINLAILDHLTPCPGIVLKQIYEMKKNAPEFFYYSLEKVKDINLSAMSLFTHFLAKLFEN